MGSEIFAAPARIAVRNIDHIPYIGDSPHPVLGKAIADEWDRDFVLTCLAHALPVPIRRQVTSEWSVERGAGFTSRVHDGSLRFAAPGRAVVIDVHQTPSDRDLDDVHATMLGTAPVAK